MAEIELAPLSHRLDEEEVKNLGKLLTEAGAPPFEKADEHASHTIAARLSEEALTEFLDRLDAHDLGAEIYVPRGVRRAGSRSATSASHRRRRCWTSSRRCARS